MPENCASHSFDVSVVAHMIAMIGVHKFKKTYNPSDIAVAGLYHESSESAGIGDLPSPLKYANEEITRVVKQLENDVERSLVKSGLPDYLQPHFQNIVVQQMVDKEVKAIVKAADDIAAYLKASEELNMNNLGYLKAEQNLKARIKVHCDNYAEVKEFVETQMPHCMETIDTLTNPNDKSKPLDYERNKIDVDIRFKTT